MPTDNNELNHEFDHQLIPVEDYQPFLVNAIISKQLQEHPDRITLFKALFSEDELQWMFSLYRDTSPSTLAKLQAGLSSVRPAS